VDPRMMAMLLSFSRTSDNSNHSFGAEISITGTVYEEGEKMSRRVTHELKKGSILTSDCVLCININSNRINRR
jgi:hypothetical protein